MTTDKLAVRQLETDDCSWVAEVMDERRQRYAPLSPRFWNPAPNAGETHLAFLMWLVMQDDTLALRTDEGFIIGTVQGGRVMVDDFAVTADERWAIDGRALLTVLASEAARSITVDHVRVVTARLDEPKRSMLERVGLTPRSRWWVTELDRPDHPHQSDQSGQSGGEPARGDQRVAGHDLSIIDAPPVYDPGGPVALVEDPTSDSLPELISKSAELGAALLITVASGEGVGPWDGDGDLVDAGFHNASEFWDGLPA